MIGHQKGRGTSQNIKELWYAHRRATGKRCGLHNRRKNLNGRLSVLLTLRGLTGVEAEREDRVGLSLDLNADVSFEITGSSVWS